jgi:hypothetical protein
VSGLHNCRQESNPAASIFGKYLEDLDIQGARSLQMSTLQCTLSSEFYKKSHIQYVSVASSAPFITGMQRTAGNAPCPPWGIPVNISVPANADRQRVTSWDHLRFSPIGAYHLRCWQGVFPGVKDFFITCQGRFRSADIAWFASGMNRDGNHSHPQASFHPSLVTLVMDTGSTRGKLERKALLAEVKEQLFDVVSFFFILIPTDHVFIRRQCMID